MTYPAIQSLWQNKLRLALSIGGVALAMMLIILLNGFLVGIYDQVTAYPNNTSADLIVAQDGEFKRLIEMAFVPVCGMALDKEIAPAEISIDGRTYSFCAMGCRDEFLADPAQFMSE